MDEISGRHYLPKPSGGHVKCTLRQWCELWENFQRVSITIVGQVRVSTVFLGLDHGFGSGPPVLYETMTFGGEHDQDSVRYETRREAKEGHAMTVMLIENGLHPFAENWT